MSKVTHISSRKTDHIRINLEEDVRSGRTTGLELLHFQHCALPELDLEDVDLSLSLFDKSLKAPLLISSMTGGTLEAQEVNRVLAVAAQETGIAMGLGSQRAAIENPELAVTFQVRDLAPDVLLFSNLGVVQLNYGFGLEECKRAVDMVQSDALILHFNALQEAVQGGGDTRWSGLLNKVETICHGLTVPVVAKEVGWGFSESDVRNLINAGISAIDVAGAGGTSWTQVEMHRATDDSQRRLAAAFSDWGIPTAQAILNVRRVSPDIISFASGGLRTGVDICKCIALGARLGGLAGPFLKAAVRSIEETIQTISELKREMQVCMFAAGVGDLDSLSRLSLLRAD